MGPLSIVTPPDRHGAAITAGLAFALLGERLGRLQGIGVCAALAGVVLVSLRGWAPPAR